MVARHVYEKAESSGEWVGKASISPPERESLVGGIIHLPVQVSEFSYLYGVPIVHEVWILMK